MAVQRFKDTADRYSLMKNLGLVIGIRKSSATALIDRVGNGPSLNYAGPTFLLLAIVALSVFVPSLPAQQSQTPAGSPQVAWTTIQQLVQNLEDAVQSKNLHGIHEPSMKIRAPIRALKQHSSMLDAETSPKMVAALKKLDNAVTDLHSAADTGDQKEAETGLKEVQTAFDQLKSLDPEAAFKNMH